MSIQWSTCMNACGRADCIVCKQLRDPRYNARRFTRQRMTRSEFVQRLLKEYGIATQ